MSTQQEVFNLVKRLVGLGYLKSAPDLFARFFGGEWNKAIFLSQLLYLSDKGARKDGFIWKSYKDWESEIYVKERTLRRYVRDFEKRGILETKLLKVNGSPTVHYRIIANVFIDQLKEFVKNEKINKVLPNGIGQNVRNEKDKMSETININNNINNNIKDIREISKFQETINEDLNVIHGSLLTGSLRDHQWKAMMDGHKEIDSAGTLLIVVKEKQIVDDVNNRLNARGAQNDIANAGLSFKRIELVQQ